MIEVNIVDLLNSDTVQFTFVKANGEERVAVGTRNMNLIPEDKHPKEKSPEKFPEVTVAETVNPVVTYYDLDACAWRSFKLNSVKEVHEYGNIR